MRLVGTDVQEEVLDNVLVPETREEHKFIIDGTECFASMQEESALPACVGDRFELDRIIEVRMLTVQKNGKGEKNRKIQIAIRRERKK